jgi:hypothetical protein
MPTFSISSYSLIACCYSRVKFHSPCSFWPKKGPSGAGAAGGASTLIVSFTQLILGAVELDLLQMVVFEVLFAPFESVSLCLASLVSLASRVSLTH